MRKISILLAFSLLVTFTTPNFIKAQSLDGISIVERSPNTIDVQQGDELTRIRVENEVGKTTVTLTNMGTGEDEYFIRDEEKGLIYSSITNKTIPIETKNEFNEKESGVQLFSTTYSKKIPVSKILSIVGYGSGAAGIAGGIATLVGSATTGGILGIITGLGIISSQYLSDNYPNGYFLVSYRDSQYCKWHGGSKRCYPTKVVTNIRIYK